MKIRILKANTEMASVHWHLPSWFYENSKEIKPAMLDYRDELRQQARWNSERAWCGSLGRNLAISFQMAIKNHLTESQPPIADQSLKQ